MGIDPTGLNALVLSLNYVSNKKNILTLGRQKINIGNHIINDLLNKFNLSHLQNKYNACEFCEKFLNDLGFENVDSVDNSSYEGANIIHNFNLPIEITKKYDFILDGGTTEHIFNAPQVVENIIDLLEIDGIYCSIVPNNNLSGHGIYQFSPEFFLSAFSKNYGMEIKELYLAKLGSFYEDWINVNDLKSCQDGRNCSKFNTLDEVYIIAIAKKISNNRKSLIHEPPNQYSYENIDWNN